MAPNKWAVPLLSVIAAGCGDATGMRTAGDGTENVFDGSAPTTGDLLFHETFSDGLNEERWILQCRQAYSCDVFTENGNRFFRSTWRPWDIRILADTLSGNGGAELAERAPAATHEAVDRDLWYAWRFRVMDLTALENDFAGGVINGQFHHQESLGPGASPPIAIHLRTDPGAADDQLSLQLKLPCTEGTPGCRDTGCGGGWCLTLRPLTHRLPHDQRGQWHTVELHIFWSAASDGWVRWFVDGKSVLVEQPGLPWAVGSARLTGIRTLPNGFPNYFKLGQYVVNFADNYPQWETPPGQIVVDFDDMAIGTDRRSVTR
jgi:hypothetical protein